MYLYPPDTDAAARECRHDANDAMYDVRTYLRHVASLDDDTLDRMDDAEAHDLARQFTQPQPRCHHCFGDGWLPKGYSSEPCPHCQGTGVR